jgi:hypothetical protein
MLRRRAATIGIAASAFILVSAGSALADDCANVSRAPAPCGYSCSGPVIVGNWVWLPSLDPSAPPIWGFAPPGAADSVTFGLPGANGNYTNGQAQDLLGVAGHHSSAVCSTPNRTATDFSQLHGIVSACGQATG